MVRMVEKIRKRVEKLLPGFEVRVEYGELQDLAVVKIAYPLPSGGYVSDEITLHHASDGVMLGRVMLVAEELIHLAYEDYEQFYHKEEL